MFNQRGSGLNVSETGPSNSGSLNSRRVTYPLHQAGTVNEIRYVFLKPRK